LRAESKRVQSAIEYPSRYGPLTFTAWNYSL